jgi:hypothetical protein
MLIVSKLLPAQAIDLSRGLGGWHERPLIMKLAKFGHHGKLLGIRGSDLLLHLRVNDPRGVVD